MGKMFLLRCVLLHFVWITSLEANQKTFQLGDTAKTPTESDRLIQDLIKRVEVLEERDMSHVQVLEELERTHRKEIDELKQELNKQKNEIKSLRKNSIGQDRLIARLMQHMKVCTGLSAPDYEDNGDTVQKIYVKNKINRIRRAENEVAIAFTAGLTHTFSHAGAHQNIVFDHVETNTGNGYNSHHGVFTAPVAGLYVFYTSVLADNNREVWCQIVVNGKNKGSVYARGTDGRHDQGSQAIIVHLQQGNDVAVQNVAADDSIFGDSDIYSTFSGFLLQQDFTQSGSIVG